MTKKKIIIGSILIIVLLYFITNCFLAAISVSRQFSSIRIKRVYINDKRIVSFDESIYIAIYIEDYIDSASSLFLSGVSYQKDKVIIVTATPGFLSEMQSNYLFTTPSPLLIPIDKLDNGKIKFITIENKKEQLLFSIIKDGNEVKFYKKQIKKKKCNNE